MLNVCKKNQTTNFFLYSTAKNMTSTPENTFG